MQVLINREFQRRDDYVAFMEFIVQHHAQLQPRAIHGDSTEQVIGSPLYLCNLVRAQRLYAQDQFPIRMAMSVSTEDDDLGILVKMKWG